LGRQQVGENGRRSASSRNWKQSEIHQSLGEGESNQRLRKEMIYVSEYFFLASITSAAS